MIQLFALLALLSLSSTAAAQGNGHLQLHFMDVGQGDGAVLITPGGQSVLFDNGVMNQCNRPVTYLLRLGLTRIDYHVASHYHADHIGCTDEVFAAMPLQQVAFDRGGSYTTQTYARYVSAVGSKRQTVSAGSTLALEGGVSLDFIAANGAGVPGADDENDLSVAVRVRYGSFDAAIAGDLSGVDGGGYVDVETTVAPQMGRVEVYKVNHHASRYSSNANWLSTLTPKVGIVSVGASNSFGHPTADAMSRLHAAGVQSYWTSAGRGVPPNPTRDFVGGDIVVDVAPNGSTFTVGAAGQTHTYTMWGGQSSPPGAPQNLTTTVNGNTATFNWQPPSTGGVPTSYVLEASFTAGGPIIASLPLVGTSLAVPSVPNGTYYVHVRAVNSDGLSGPSNEVIVLVPGGGGGCTSPPNPAQALTGSANGNTVTLNWAAASGGCTATAYAVHAGSASGQSNLAVVNVGASMGLSASAPPGSYFVRVIALNVFGSSGASNEITITVGAGCQVPGAPMLLSPTVSGSTVSLNWIGAGGNVTGYVVEAGSSSGAANLLNTMTGATAYNWTNAPGGTHFLRVRAMNGCGVGPASNQVTATVSSAPPPPPPPNVCGPTNAPCGAATARCNDGTYSCSQNRSGTCSSHGGVSCWICPGRLCSGDDRSRNEDLAAFFGAADAGSCGLSEQMSDFVR